MRLIIDEDHALRIDVFLTERLEHYSRSQIKKLFDAHKVLINNFPIKPSYKLKEGDIVDVDVSFDSYVIEPMDLGVEIVYEDEDVLVVNKPKGMLIHPSISSNHVSLVNHLLFHTKHLSTSGGQDRPGIVHRLDKDTSGLLVVAKNNLAHESLANQFRLRQTKKIYECICFHPFVEESGTIDAPIGRDPFVKTKMSVNEEGKLATTHFKVITQNSEYAHLEVSIVTGRTHQIRVHLSYITHPILGDTVYGSRKQPLYDGQILHARTLGFTHPKTGQYLEFSAPIPAYFKEALTLSLLGE